MILIGELTETADMLISQLSNFKDYRQDFLSLKNEKRRREYLGVRIVMNILTGKNVIVNYDRDNKPFLLHDERKISISHSGDFIAVIIHPKLDVGIDIECVSDKIKRVYKRFLSEDEQNSLYRESDSSAIEIAWSAKEALFKLIGGESYDFAGKLNILPFESQSYGNLKASYAGLPEEYTLHYHKNAVYTLVYCIDNKEKHEI